MCVAQCTEIGLQQELHTNGTEVIFLQLADSSFQFRHCFSLVCPCPRHRFCLPCYYPVLLRVQHKINEVTANGINS